MNTYTKYFQKKAPNTTLGAYFVKLKHSNELTPLEMRGKNTK